MVSNLEVLYVKYEPGQTEFGKRKKLSHKEMHTQSNVQWVPLVVWDYGKI